MADWLGRALERASVAKTVGEARGFSTEGSGVAEAVAAGPGTLVGPGADRIVSAAERLLDDDAEYGRMARIHNPYGDGNASDRILRAIAAYFSL